MKQKKRTLRSWIWLFLLIFCCILLSGCSPLENEEKKSHIENTNVQKLPSWPWVLVKNLGIILPLSGEKAERAKAMKKLFEEEVEKFNARHTEEKINIFIENLSDFSYEGGEMLIEEKFQKFKDTMDEVRVDSSSSLLFQQPVHIDIAIIQMVRRILDGLFGVVGGENYAVGNCNETADIKIWQFTLKACNQGAKEVGDPGDYLMFDDALKACPVGYHLPSVNEWIEVYEAFQRIEEKLAYKLYLPFTTYPNFEPLGTANGRSEFGMYRGQEGERNHAEYFTLLPRGYFVGIAGKWLALSVRCFKDRIPVVHLGVIAHLSTNISCGEEGIHRYQDAVQNFNISHTGLQIELITGNQDETSIVEKLFMDTSNAGKGLAGIVSVNCETPKEEITENLLRRYETGRRGQTITLWLIVPFRFNGFNEWRTGLIDAFTEKVNAFNRSHSDVLIHLKVLDGQCENGEITTFSQQYVDIYANPSCPKSDIPKQYFMGVAHNTTQWLLQLFPNGELSGKNYLPNCRTAPLPDIQTVPYYFVKLCQPLRGLPQ